MKYVLYTLIFTIITLPVFAQNTVYQAGHESLQHWLIPQQSNPNEYQLKLIELGKKLFFDKRLSSSGEVSCSSCHDPEKGWEDGLVKAQAIDGKISRLHTPTIVNLAFSGSFTWNGRSNSLTDEAYHAFSPKGFINAKPKLSFEGVTELLNSIPYYRTTFNQLFPEKKLQEKIFLLL